VAGVDSGVVVDLGSILRNPFSFLFARSRKEQRLVEYVIREHGHGRTLDEVLDDPFVRNRTTAEQRGRLVEHPDVVRAVGADMRR
jgi:hypothetical protein